MNINQAIQEFKNKKIAVLGLGVNNWHLVFWLLEKGIQLTICDQNPAIKQEVIFKTNKKEQKLLKGVKGWRSGKSFLKNLDNFDLVFRTPGIPYLHSKIQEAKKKGVEISSQTKLFFDLCPSVIVGVTGTKGKGTTSSLIYEILKKIKNSKIRQRIQNVYLAGNIGRDPFEFADELTKDDIVVLELSSFQLQDLHKSPNVALVLNVSSDHLDYHKNAKEYIEAKYNIVNYQGVHDKAVINADYLISAEFGAKSAGENYWFSTKKRVEPGTYLNKEDFVYVNGEGEEEKVCSTSDLRLVGCHNWENVAAAIAAVKIFGVSNKDIKAVLQNFTPLPHRLEFVGEVDGVRYFDDSFSTTPETTVAAIKSFDSPIVLICGGSSKEADFSEMTRVIASSNVKTVVLIGEEADRIKSKIQNPKIIDKKPKTMREIVDLAKNEAQKGDIVLLSPGCASFDMFKNATDRGEQFKGEVLRLKI